MQPQHAAECNWFQRTLASFLPPADETAHCKGGRSVYERVVLPQHPTFLRPDIHVVHLMSVCQLITMVEETVCT
jgi:hypothetical protein